MGCKVSLALCERYTYLSDEKKYFGFGRFWSILVGFGRFQSVSGPRFQMSLEPFAALRAVC
eukprot:2927427-Prymnesium_polylepis.1